ncbi:nucleotidyltransferase family protein [Paraburkholderia azotifigens]|uniref:Nucleotidyltransferase domain-containing protein n=1 Tax=Paraburkholderia azotifigens TaxID=2057004 RepID=A0A5C6VJ52_9BURK|nr:nucleotidyltransferase domain-containing protein [Paraburkholderia azotifigens]TXC84496.1 nucleotidyltransferase domain-containing protein [Paraburkholderia azotifigens]
MDINEIRDVVLAWAKTEELLLKVWLFGSRVRGTERSDSDIDIAVEVQTLAGDSSAWTTFMFEKPRLQKAIEALLPMEVQLEWYGGPEETPTIHAALFERSMLIYERA